MYFKRFYKRIEKSKIIEDIKKEGFEPTIFTNSAGDVYTPHQHPETKLLVFIKGEMTVEVGDKTFKCSKGDKLLIPGNIVHSAQVGPSGCTFFWSEKLIK